MLDAKLVAAGSVALAVTLVAIFSLRPLAPRLGLIDRPDGRKRHRGRIPTIGGLCFFLGMVIGLGLFGALDRFVMALLATGAVIMLTGLMDDMYDLSVGSRLVIQAGAAVAVIAASGVHVDSLGILGASEVRLYAWGIPLTVIAVVGMINAFNMMDGIDGLAGGLALVCILAVLAFATRAGWQALGVLLLLQILLVAMIPYIGVNLGWPDGRKIFMGDAGSTLLGFLLAWCLIFLSRREVALLAPVDALWCVALPVMDTLAVMVRRMAQGHSPFKADRQHLHHLMLDAGCSTRATLAVIVGAAGLLAVVGYTLRDIPHPANLTIFAGVVALYVTQLPHALHRAGGVLRRRAPSMSGGTGNALGGVLAFDGARAERPDATGRGRPPLKALCVLDDSPDLVTVALIAQRLRLDCRFDTHVCLTDAASDARQKVLGLFDIRSDVELDLGQAGTDATDVTSAALNEMKRVLDELRPDVVIVHGDTPAMVAAMLAACHQKIPVARIDSATGFPGAPDPSCHRINRRLASALASLHLTPTQSACEELVAAGVPRERITVTGNPAVETLRAAIERIRRNETLQQEMIRRFSYLRHDRPLVLVAHQEQIADFRPLGCVLRKVARRRPDVDILYPTVATPDMRKLLQPPGWQLANVHLVDPLDFLAFAYLLQSACLVLTGSCEVESQASMLGKSVLLLSNGARQERARDPDSPLLCPTIANNVVALLEDTRTRDLNAISPVGDDPGRDGERDACFRIVDALASVPARSSALAA